jgi:hypothetical protein
MTQKLMSTITIPLADEDFSFLQAYSMAQGTSLEAFLARQARCLRERLQKPTSCGSQRCQWYPPVDGQY